MTIKMVCLILFLILGSVWSLVLNYMFLWSLSYPAHVLQAPGGQTPGREALCSLELTVRLQAGQEPCEHARG